MNYKNPVPVAVCLVPVDCGGQRKLLGVIRNIEPNAGGAALPGGYADEGESAEQAAARELLEECGIHTDAADWKLISSRTNATNRMLVFCVLNKALPASSVLQLPVVSKEVRGYLLIDEATPLTFPLHAEAVAAYFESRRKAAGQVAGLLALKECGSVDLVAQELLRVLTA